MLCELSSPVTKATNNGLKLLLGQMVKCSCFSPTTKYEVCGPLGCCCRLGTTSTWTGCGSGTGDPRTCRLLWLTSPFHCPALYLSWKFHCLVLKSLKVSFLQVFNFVCQVVAEGCSGGLLSGPKEIYQHSLCLGNLRHVLLVDWWRIGHCTYTGIAADGCLVCLLRADDGLHTVVSMDPCEML